jgi:hypothetical protein
VFGAGYYGVVLFMDMEPILWFTGQERPSRCTLSQMEGSMLRYFTVGALAGFALVTFCRKRVQRTGYGLVIDLHLPPGGVVTLWWNRPRASWEADTPRQGASWWPHESGTCDVRPWARNWSLSSLRADRPERGTTG